MATHILKQEGVMVHLGGAGHLYGPYQNLYERLKEKVEVERFRLIEFHSGLKTPETRAYIDKVRRILRKNKKSLDDFLEKNPL